ncbi:hypothetical protein ACFVX6_25840 [Streptomyces sp. NPDC058289]|uniref:hypothetical protein n=1 Tax=Streptomyces sp. NPDC058289 TaxID=3346425 RepID=UPI0036EA5599
MTERRTRKRRTMFERDTELTAVDEPLDQLTDPGPHRPDELPAHAEAFRTLPGRAGHRPLSLAPLTAEAVSGLVREAVGEHADEAFCREDWAVTPGNPFEAVELTANVRAGWTRPGSCPGNTSTGSPSRRLSSSPTPGPSTWNCCWPAARRRPQRRSSRPWTGG